MGQFKKAIEKLPFKVSPYVLIIVILSIVIIVSLQGRRSQDNTFDAFIDSYTAFDANAIVSLMPKEYISALIEEGKIENKANLVTNIQNVLDYMKEKSLHYDEDIWEYNYEIVYTEEGSKKDSNLVFSQIQREFCDYGSKIKQVVIIHYDPIITHQNYNDEIVDEYESRTWVKLVKIGQKWYVAEFRDIEHYGFTT